MALTVAIILAFFAPWPWNLIAILTGLGIETVELTWGLRLARRWRPQTGAEAMIGQLAQVVVSCHPTGKVRFHGELWEARCAAASIRRYETLAGARRFRRFCVRVAEASRRSARPA